MPFESSILKIDHIDACGTESSLILFTPVERQELIDLIIGHVQDPDIQPFTGRIPTGLGRSTANAVVFKVTCHCGVSAMLSVDVPTDSTDEKIVEMAPHLAAALDRQAKQFHGYPCDVHARISMG